MDINKLNCAGRVREVIAVRSSRLPRGRRSCQRRRHDVLSLSSTKDFLMLATVSFSTTLSKMAKERRPHSTHGLTFNIVGGYVAGRREEAHVKRISLCVLV